MLRAALGDAAFLDAWDVGQALTLEQAVAEALQALEAHGQRAVANMN